MQRVLSERLAPSPADELVVRADELRHPAEVSLGQLAVVMSDDASPACGEPELGRVLGRSLDGNVYMDRLALLARIRAHFVRAYASIAPHEVADMAYQPSIGDLEHAGAATSADDAARAKLRHEAQERFLACLEERADEELRRGLTLSGPHRDDMNLMIGGVDVRRFGSQGQQRTAALSLKLSELELMQRISRDNPVLLLDDVLSELDGHRQNQLLSAIRHIQTIITCTGLDEFVNNRFPIDRIFKAAEHTVKCENE